VSATLALLRADEHVSVSAITTYLRCPRQYQHRYVLRSPPEHRPSALAFGSAIHEALAGFYTGLKAGIEPIAAALQDTFTASWQDQLDQDLPILFGAKESANALADKGRAMLDAFHRETPRPHRVVGVEEPFSVLLDCPSIVRPSNIRLVGVFDAVIQNADGGYAILEHKQLLAATRKPVSPMTSRSPPTTSLHPSSVSPMRM
jgi:RecB family exonuclease